MMENDPANKTPLRIIDIAIIRTEEFLSVDFDQFRAQSKAKSCIELADFYLDLSLFPNDDILFQMRLFGLEEDDLRWFIPYKSLDAELTQLTKQNIEVEPVEAYFCIKAHLHYKILHTLTKRAGFVTEGAEKSLVYMEYHNLDRRKRYTKKREKDPNNLFDLLMSEQYNLIKAKEGNEGIERQKDLMQGKTEKYFLKQLIVNTLTPPPEMSERKFHCAIFNLMRLLVPKDQEMLTGKEFEAAKGYDRDYDVYRDKRIRDIFF